MKASARKIFPAFFMLSGTVIGASFLALPYIAAKTGLALMLGYLLFLTVIVLIIHLFYAEVAAGTADFLRLPSYAGVYLGKTGKTVALGATVAGFLGSLLSYIIIGESFLSSLLAPLFGGMLGNSHLLYAFAFFALGAIVVFLGKKAVSEIDFLDVILFIFALVAILIFGWPSWKGANLLGGSAGIAAARTSFDFFLPYGVLLSALWGATVIPEMEEILGEHKKSLRKIVSWGVIVPAIFYLFFILVTLGIAGSEISPEGINGLKNYLPLAVGSFLLIFGIVVVFTSYISLGLALRNMLRYDFKLKKKLAWAISCFVPFLFYLVGFRNFIDVIGFVGGVALAIQGILIILMYNKIKQHWILTLPLILILLAGIVYEIIYFLNF